MRGLGILLFCAGAAATALATVAAFERRRPMDLVFALAAPIAVLVAVLGLVLAFVPGFFG